MPAAAANQDEEAQLLKAAYIYNFAKFTRWDETPDAETLKLCVFGNDSLSEALQRLAGKWVGERRIVIHAITDSKSVQACQILYFAMSERGDYREFVQALERQPVLTISEIEGFTSNGGMIELFHEAERIRFKINVNTVEQGGLAISSRLLKLAEIVRRKDTQ